MAIAPELALLPLALLSPLPLEELPAEAEDFAEAAGAAAPLVWPPLAALPLPPLAALPLPPLPALPPPSPPDPPPPPMFCSLFAVGLSWR